MNTIITPKTDAEARKVLIALAKNSGLHSYIVPDPCDPTLSHSFDPLGMNFQYGSEDPESLAVEHVAELAGTNVIDWISGIVHSAMDAHPDFRECNDCGETVYPSFEKCPDPASWKGYRIESKAQAACPHCGCAVWHPGEVKGAGV